ncbi:hypothetical protein WI642_01785 [Vibrio cholerae]
MKSVDEAIIASSGAGVEVIASQESSLYRQSTAAKSIPWRIVRNCRYTRHTIIRNLSLIHASLGDTPKRAMTPGRCLVSMNEKSLVRTGSALMQAKHRRLARSRIMPLQPGEGKRG